MPRGRSRGAGQKGFQVLAGARRRRPRTVRRRLLCTAGRVSPGVGPVEMGLLGAARGETLPERPAPEGRSRGCEGRSVEGAGVPEPAGVLEASRAPLRAPGLSGESQGLGSCENASPGAGRFVLSLTVVRASAFLSAACAGPGAPAGTSFTFHADPPSRPGPGHLGSADPPSGPGPGTLLVLTQLLGLGLVLGTSGVLPHVRSLVPPWVC